MRFAGEFRSTVGPRTSRAVAPDVATRWRAAGRTDGAYGSSGPLALGHRRLTIIDLSARRRAADGRQRLGLSLVFNGCIYNYQELRAELRGTATGSSPPRTPR